jgi:hypothetical protein
LEPLKKKKKRWSKTKEELAAVAAVAKKLEDWLEGIKTKMKTVRIEQS